MTAPWNIPVPHPRRQETLIPFAEYCMSLLTLAAAGHGADEDGVERGSRSHGFHPASIVPGRRRVIPARLF